MVLSAIVSTEIVDYWLFADAKKVVSACVEEGGSLKGEERKFALINFMKLLM